jgi:putative oxidoreductase
MSLDAGRSSHGALSHADGIAAGATDACLLVGRILLGWLFLASSWVKLTNMAGFAAYLTNLRVPNAAFWSWVAAPIEFLFGLSLILGLATRYAALAAIVFVIVATALGHRYWEFPQAQQLNQFNHFLKNLAVIAGALLVFVTGPGRYSLDELLRRRRP